MGIETGSAPGIPLVIQALHLALEDDLPETRLSAFLPLCWIRCPEAEACLLDGFHREPNSDVKARMLASAVNLMSPMSGRLLEESLADPDPLLRQTAEHFSS